MTDVNGILLTATELAERLRVSVKTIYRMTVAGDLPYIKVGPTYRYDYEAVKVALSPSSKPAGAWAQSRRSLGRTRAI